MSRVVATGFEEYDPLSDNTRFYIPPPPGTRNGKSLTGAEIRYVIERFGPMYVAKLNPEWARGGRINVRPS